MNLDEMQALEKQATKGPWYPSLIDEHPYGIHSKNKAICGEGFGSDGIAVPIDIPDAKFIAASREWVPLAIKRIRELENKNLKLEHIMAAIQNVDHPDHWDYV